MTKIIDISSWQDATTPEIDFEAVRASGVVGVMIKFTQGVDYTNPKARTNFAKAHDAGLLVGAYHVGEPGKNTAEAEAEFFLRSIDGLLVDLATALDLENFGSLGYGEAQTWAEKWLEALKGRAPYDLIYLNEHLFTQLGTAPWGFKLWAAQFVPENNVTPFMVQQPPTTVPGINGKVDVSVLTSLRAVNIADPTSAANVANLLRVPVLRKGDTGLAVKILQQLLRQNAYNIAVDGDFGPNTFDAVENFQGFTGLAVDGIVGPLTWGALAPDHHIVIADVHPVVVPAENLGGTGLDSQDVADLQAQVDGINKVADSLAPENNGIDEATRIALERGYTPPVQGGNA